MYASVRRYRVMDAQALIKKMEEEFIDRVKTMDGFVDFYVIDGGDGTVTSITLGDVEEAVEASTAQARDWVVERAAHLVEGAPDVTAGEVRVSADRS